MDKKRRIINTLLITGMIVCAIMAIFPVVASSVLYGRAEQSGFSKKIFTDLASLEFLDHYKLETDEIKDEFIEEFNPTGSYLATVEYENRKYTIYAYMFRTNDGAHDYYLKATGISDGLYAKGLYYTYTTGIKSQYYAYYENCVFRVEGGGFTRFCEFIEWLSKDFPVDIREEFNKEFGYYPSI